MPEQVASEATTQVGWRGLGKISGIGPRYLGQPKANPTKPDHELIPSAIFTRPEYGTVGLTEEVAREQEEIEVYCAAFMPMQNAFIGKTERVLFKLIVSCATRKILGCHIIADGAGELIQMVGVAVKMGATKEDFDRTVAVHPTMSEEIVLMKTPVRTA